MRFLQQEKFSYITRKIFGVEKISSNNELIENEILYEKFLKSTLLETLISLIFLAVSAKFLLTYYKAIKHTFSVDDPSKLRIFRIHFISFFKTENYNMTDNLFNTNNLIDMELLESKFKNSFHIFETSFNNVASKSSPVTRDIIAIRLQFAFSKDKMVKSISFSEIFEDKVCPMENYSKLDDSFEIFLSIENHEPIFKCILRLISLTKFKIEFYFYSSQFDLIEISKFDLILKTRTTRITELDYYRNLLRDKSNLIIVLLSLAFVFYYLIEECLELYNYKLGHLMHLLNIVDIIILINWTRIVFIFMYKVLVNRFISQKIKTIYNNKTKDLDNDTIKEFVYESLKADVLNTNDFEFEFNFTIISLLLTWTKLFKFVNFSTGLTQMNAAIAKSFNHLFSYLFIYAIVFLAHAELMHRLLGQMDKDYSSRILAQFTLFRMLLASVDFEPIVESSSIQIIFFSFYFLVFIIFSGIFLAIISDSYSYVVENYEPRPELEYYLFFKKRLKIVSDLFEIKPSLNKLQDMVNIDLRKKSMIIMEELGESVKPSDFRMKLLKSGFESVDIDMTFKAYEIAEKRDESDQVEESVIDPEICAEIIKKLDFAKKRILTLNKRKLSFLKSEKCNSDDGSNFSKFSNFSFSNPNNSNLEISKNLDIKLEKVKSNNTINDEVNELEYDNFYTELTTWNDFKKLKYDLSDIETNINKISDSILEAYERKIISSNRSNVKQDPVLVSEQVLL